MGIKTILITAISAIFAGMGIGGGALFILLATMFLNLQQKEAQALNLIMFIAVGISATLTNFKSHIIEKRIVKKIIPMLFLGMLVGIYLVERIDNEDLKKYFLIFILITGIYEIISSLIKIKNAKDNNR